MTITDIYTNSLTILHLRTDTHFMIHYGPGSNANTRPLETVTSPLLAITGRRKSLVVFI